MTIKLHQFPAGAGVPNLSSFCMKVETWLRLAGLKYEVVNTPDPGKGPLGKLPFITDGDQQVADSANIIEHLSRAYGKDLDAGLSPAQRAVSHAFTRMLAEHTYWGVVYTRWLRPEGWIKTRKIFFGGLPPGVRQLAAALVQRKMVRDMHGHGLGRHPEAEILRRTEQDLASVSAQLGSQEFMFGASPTTLDASVYAFLASMWEARVDSPLKAVVGKYPNLVAYCARMRARCFPELPKIKELKN